MAKNQPILEKGRPHENLTPPVETGSVGNLPHFEKMNIDNFKIKGNSRNKEELAPIGNDFFRQVLDSLPYPLYVIDIHDYTVLVANNAASEGFIPNRNKCYTLTHGSKQPCSGSEHPCPLRHVKQTRKPFAVEHIHIDKQGNPRIVEVHGQPIFDGDGNVAQLIVSNIDITEYRQAEEKLKLYGDQLEDLVEQRTAELKSEQEALKSKNAALKEILSNIENEKSQMALQIQSNIDRIAMPILRMLKEQSSAGQKHYISLLENSFGDIASPFIGRLEKERSRLTQREIEICNMIKNDMTSKQIASVLMTSPETVRVQRKSIRKKLGISGEKTSLKLILRKF